MSDICADFIIEAREIIEVGLIGRQRVARGTTLRGEHLKEGFDMAAAGHAPHSRETASCRNRGGGQGVSATFSTPSRWWLNRS